MRKRGSAAGAVRQLPEPVIGIAIGLTICAAVVWTFLVTYLHDATTDGSLQHLKYGAPLHWITQDQSHNALPAGTRHVVLASPMDVPTHFHVAPLVMDLVFWVAALVLYVLTAIGLTTVWRSRRASR